MRLTCFPLVALCCLTLAAAAQQPAAPAAAAQSPAATPPSQGQIQLDVVVTDQSGKPVTGLSRSDFTLLDNNHPADIQSFEANGGSAATPPQIILVFDMVNIGFDQVSYSRGGLDEFLRSDGGRLGAPVQIYWYTETGLSPLKGETAPTSDGNALAAEIDATSGQLRMVHAGGSWAGMERYQMSLQTFSNMASAASAQPGRKLLIWIGPGWPLMENMELSEKDQNQLFGNIVTLSTMLREGRMQVYSVAAGMPDINTYRYQGYTKGVKKPTQASLPNLDLKVLAEESGGLAVPPSNDLASQIEQCAREANAYYTITFNPPPGDKPNDYHQLKIHVDKPGLTARTNTGYYNQPPGR